MPLSSDRRKYRPPPSPRAMGMHMRPLRMHGRMRPPPLHTKRKQPAERRPSKKSDVRPRQSNDRPRPRDVHPRQDEMSVQDKAMSIQDRRIQTPINGALCAATGPLLPDEYNTPSSTPPPACAPNKQTARTDSWPTFSPDPRCVGPRSPTAV
eukprot:90796-Chlamydomonas_euryale.AAC.4